MRFLLVPLAFVALTAATAVGRVPLSCRSIRVLTFCSPDLRVSFGEEEPTSHTQAS